jgi:hypothetical protein
MFLKLNKRLKKANEQINKNYFSVGNYNSDESTRDWGNGRTRTKFVANSSNESVSFLYNRIFKLKQTKHNSTISANFHWKIGTIC